MTNLQQLEKRIRELVTSLQEVADNFVFVEADIHLHHVLQAIVKKETDDMTKWVYITGFTEEKLYFANHGNDDTVEWNLPLPLSGQSEETIKFLLEILK